MKKKIRITLIVIVSLVILYALLGQFGFLKLYYTASTATEPGLKLNSKWFVTNLITPNRGDFICYDHFDETFGQNIWVNRLVAKEKDTILIENGTIYINGENIDKNIELMHYYEITKREYNKLKKDNQITEITINNLIGKDAYIINLKDKIAIEYGFLDKKKITPKNEVSSEIRKIYERDWNKDNFGKLIIPKDKFFVVGDNRDNSQDSRYTGLIDKKDIVGVVIKF